IEKVTPAARAPTLEHAEAAYAEGRKAEAAQQLRALAEGRMAQAQLRLAQLYERGEGVLQSFVEAVRWYKKAADDYCVPAMARLGEIYLTGMAAPATASPAALEKISGGTSEKSLLKSLYPQGLAVAQDFGQAATWNARAAEAGDAAAQARLGYQYATGLGRTRDLNEAERWFSAAAKQQHAA